jgi:hypothetical protein
MERLPLSEALELEAAAASVSADLAWTCRRSDTGSLPCELQLVARPTGYVMYLPVFISFSVTVPQASGRHVICTRGSRRPVSAHWQNIVRRYTAGYE